MDELYLTNENQQYRTQKLIRTALGDMDKTENKVAKNNDNALIFKTHLLPPEHTTILIFHIVRRCYSRSYRGNKIGREAFNKGFIILG